MKRIWFALLPLVVAASLGAVSCGDDDVTRPPTGDDVTRPPTGQVTLQFVTADAAGIIDDILPETTPTFLNEAGQLFSIETLMYFISRVRLVRTDGETFAGSGIAYIDATRGLNDRRITFGGVPAGTYNRIRFTFGLNAEDNVSGGLNDQSVFNAGTQDILNMVWPEPLGGGYHYMKMEGRYVNPGGSDTLTYATHTGKSGQVHNFFTVEISVPAFTVEDGAHWIVEILHAFRQWYENPNTYAFPETSMIMGNPQAQTRLKENGATVFSVARAFEAN